MAGIVDIQDYVHSSAAELSEEGPRFLIRIRSLAELFVSGDPR